MICAALDGARRKSPQTGYLPQIVQINTLALNPTAAFSDSNHVRVHLTGSKAVLGSLVWHFSGPVPMEVKVSTSRPPELSRALGAYTTGFVFTEVQGRNQAKLADSESDQGPQTGASVAVRRFRSKPLDGSRRARESLCGSINRLHGGFTQCHALIPTFHR